MANRRTIQGYDDDDDSSGGGAVLLFLLAVGGVVFAVDQHDKRKKEQERFHKELEALKAQLAEKQTELAALQNLLGPKNEQVRTLADEVFQLRGKLMAMGVECRAA